jgi:hypothetical protein
MSEDAGCEVGLLAAAEDYVATVLRHKPDERSVVVV